ncbi:hypothetical protein BofuT4_uP118270.1 [Botrytis cinerea T4]|uniref:Uncharacterized protein n=1 Tax=Botryotinia fuckeliana (strain T4) TaxID=999810 RepID=G2Y0W2_BOTF4|nr:hypothetical protein BofuT4_uP118270.1 [Botrytis cinerea T4]
MTACLPACLAKIKRKRKRKRKFPNPRHFRSLPSFLPFIPRWNEMPSTVEL